MREKKNGIYEAYEPSSKGLLGSERVWYQMLNKFRQTHSPCLEHSALPKDRSTQSTQIYYELETLKSSLCTERRVS